MKNLIISSFVFFMMSSYSANAEVSCSAQNPDCLTYETILNASEVVALNQSPFPVGGDIDVECRNNAGETAIITRGTYFDANFEEVVPNLLFINYIVDCESVLKNGYFSKVLKVTLLDDATSDKAKNLVYTIK